MKIVKLIIYICWLSLIAYWLIMARKSKANVNGAKQRPKFMPILLLFFLIYLIIRPVNGQIHSTVIFFIGAVIFFLGIILSVWSRQILGVNWGRPTSIKQNPELVTGGPYKYVRHPIYSGLIMVHIGLTICLSLYFLLVLVFISVAFTRSAKIEEKNLTKIFGDSYKSYVSKTKMLIPFIY